jgi:hypothetical protein
MKYYAAVFFLFLGSCLSNRLYWIDVDEAPKARTVILTSPQRWYPLPQGVNHDFPQLFSELKSSWEKTGKELTLARLESTTLARVVYIPADNLSEPNADPEKPTVCDQQTARMFESGDADYMLIPYVIFLANRKGMLYGTTGNYQNHYCPNQDFDSLKFNYILINRNCQIAVLDQPYDFSLSYIKVEPGIFERECRAEKIEKLDLERVFQVGKEFFEALKLLRAHNK